MGQESRIGTFQPSDCLPALWASQWTNSRTSGHLASISIIKYIRAERNNVNSLDVFGLERERIKALIKGEKFSSLPRKHKMIHSGSTSNFRQLNKTQRLGPKIKDAPIKNIRNRYQNLILMKRLDYQKFIDRNTKSKRIKATRLNLRDQWFCSNLHQTGWFQYRHLRFISASKMSNRSRAKE